MDARTLRAGTGRVYCAGPLFNEAERREIAGIAEVLRREGFEPFVPHADGMEFARVRPVLIQWGHSAEAAGRLLHEAIFALDVYQVVAGCASLVLNLNGRVPDEGAVAEATMAWMLGKPVVLYKEDVRSLIEGRDNPLVVGQQGFEVVSALDGLGPALKAKIARGGHDGHEPACPRHLRTTVERGGQLWRRLEALSPRRPDEEVARIVAELFAPGHAGPRPPATLCRPRPATPAI